MKKLLILLGLLILSCTPKDDVPKGMVKIPGDPEQNVEKTTEEYNLYQGDIMLPNGSSKSTGKTNSLWPDGIVYYKISVTDNQKVLNALLTWENASNIKFVERTDELNYIDFVPSTGCSSYVGMVGGRQVINLADACTEGNTIHEIGHALGLWHEQSRKDREEYVTIHWENIQAGKENNFKAYNDAGWDGQEYTKDLDFSSIMMYSAFSFSKNGEPTITKVDGSLYSTQRNYISYGDMIGVRLMYNNFTNGDYYDILGLTVLRNFDRWYYYSSIGWRQVILYEWNEDLRWKYKF